MADPPAGHLTSNNENGTGAGNSNVSATENLADNSNSQRVSSLKRPFNESDVGSWKRSKNTESHNNQNSSDLPDDFLQPLSPDDTEIVSPPCSLIPPAPRLPTQKYDSKQFWKAGLLPSAASSSAFAAGGIEHARVHPKFLHSNATSHKWVFGAIAELLDNAVDEIRNGATFVKLDVLKNPRNGQPMLLVEDDGGGMDPEGIRHCMSLGFSAKSKLSNTIGQYGNGFKTSTMRLGADVIVFTRTSGSRPSESIGMMSYSFLATTGQDDIVVPIVDFQIQPFGIRKILRGNVDDWNESMEVIEQWSPYSSQAELVEQFKGMSSHGTKVVIYNLWEDEEGQLELDFSTDPYDIQIRGVTRDPRNIKLAERFPSCRHYFTYRHSLRIYVSILYLKLPPTFKIVLRGKEVRHHSLREEMMLVEEMTYKPSWKYDPSLKDHGQAKAFVTLGFVKDAKHHVDCQGFSLYHKNRLIKPFWRIWKNADTRGRGIIGILEANFVEPAHDKQGFEMTIVLSRLENRLLEMQRNYWQKHYSKIGYGVPGSRGVVNGRAVDQVQGIPSSRAVVNGMPGQVIPRPDAPDLQRLPIPQEVGSSVPIHGSAHGLQLPMATSLMVMKNSYGAQQNGIRISHQPDPKFLTEEQISSLPARFGIEPLLAATNVVRANFISEPGSYVIDPNVLNNGNISGERSTGIAVSNESRIPSQLEIIEIDSRESSPVASPKITFDTTENEATINCELPTSKEVTGLSSTKSAPYSVAGASEVQNTTLELLSSRSEIVECENAGGPSTVSGTNDVIPRALEGTVPNKDFACHINSSNVSDENERTIPIVPSTNECNQNHVNFSDQSVVKHDAVGNPTEMDSATKSNSPDVDIVNRLNDPRAENVDGSYKNPCDNANKEVGNTVNVGISQPSLAGTCQRNDPNKDDEGNRSASNQPPSEDVDKRASDTMVHPRLEGTCGGQIPTSTETHSQDTVTEHEIIQIPPVAEGQELLHSLAEIDYDAENTQHAQEIMESNPSAPGSKTVKASESTKHFKNDSLVQEIVSDAVMLAESEKHKQNIERTENGLEQQEYANSGIPPTVADREGTAPVTIDGFGEKEIIPNAVASMHPQCRSDEEYVEARGPADDLLNTTLDDRKKELTLRMLHAQEILGNLRQNVEATIKERDDLKKQLQNEHMSRELEMNDLRKQLEAALARLEKLQA